MPKMLEAREFITQRPELWLAVHSTGKVVRFPSLPTSSGRSCAMTLLGFSESAEIEAVERFHLERLPAQASPGTRRRIGEYLGGGAPHHGMW